MIDMKKVRREIQELIVDGVLKPIDVLEAARNPDSAMHHFFNWEDEEATGAFRVYQARILIRRAFIQVVAQYNAQAQVDETEPEPASSSG